MYRGTTPCLRLTLDTDLDLSTVKQLWVTLKNISVEITKTEADVDINSADKYIIVTLTQKETLSIIAGKVSVQVRLLLDDGRAFATNVKQVVVNDILKGGVLGE